MNIYRHLENHAKSRPQATAAIFADRRLSWEQLDRAVRSCSLVLRWHGLAAGDRVGISIDGPLAHLIASPAATRMGVAHVSMPPCEPASSREATATALGLKALVTTGAALASHGILNIGFDPVVDPAAPVDDSDTCDAENLVWLILQSSGTTGTPKFAELTHGAAAERFERFMSMFGCGIDDVMWPASSLSFVVAKQRATYALMAGAAVCLPGRISSGEKLLDFLDRASPTLACGTPGFLDQMTAVPGTAPLLASLRQFEVRSATVTEKLRAAVRERLTSHLHVVYGTNEGDALAHASPQLQAEVADTVGRVTPGLELQVVDTDGNPVAEGVIGEVRVRGPGIVSGYLDRPDANAKSFRDGWFHPGDMASFSPGGALLLHGRTDDLMIFDGINIYPAEIENVLSAHPAVREAAAFSMRHEQFQDVPAVAVVLSQPVSGEALFDYAKERLGNKHPRVVKIMTELPRNAMGKVLKRRLSENAPCKSTQR